MSLPSICPMRHLLHRPCASCGLTRAATCIVGGDLDGAIYYHAGAIPLAVLVIVTLGVWVLSQFWPRVANAMTNRRLRSVVVSLVVVLLLFGWYRNLTGDLKW